MSSILLASLFPGAGCPAGLGPSTRRDLARKIAHGLARPAADNQLVIHLARLDQDFAQALETIFELARHRLTPGGESLVAPARWVVRSR